MAIKQFSISIVIPYYKRKDLVNQILYEINNQARKTRLSTEVIIVDSNTDSKLLNNDSILIESKNAGWKFTCKNYKIDIEDYEFYISNYILIIKYLYEVIRDKLIENTSNWFTQKETDEKTNENTKDIIVNLDVNLIDIYNCEVKKVVIKVLRKDNNNLIVKKEDFYISLFDFKNQYIFKNKADDSFSKDNGDIIINVNINNNDRYYIKNEKKQKYNLYYDMDITLSEYLFGINKYQNYYNNK